MKKLLSYYLIFTLLLSLMYVPVYSHTCHLFDKTEKYVFSSPSCCESSGTSNEKIDFQCCSLSYETFVVEQESTSVEASDFQKSNTLVSLCSIYDSTLGQGKFPTEPNTYKPPTKARRLPQYIVFQVFRI